MSITVELNAGRCKKYDRATLARIAREVVLMSHIIEDIKNKKITVSIAIVSEEEIQRINREFRGKNKPTDVISIGDYSDDRDISSEENREIFLGEIILCYNYINQNIHKAYGINSISLFLCLNIYKLNSYLFHYL